MYTPVRGFPVYTNDNFAVTSINKHSLVNLMFLLPGLPEKGNVAYNDPEKYNVEALYSE